MLAFSTVILLSGPAAFPLLTYRISFVHVLVLQAVYMGKPPD